MSGASAGALPGIGVRLLSGASPGARPGRAAVGRARPIATEVTGTRLLDAAGSPQRSIGSDLGETSESESEFERAPVDDRLRAAIYRQLGFAQAVEMMLEGVCLCWAKHGAGHYREAQRNKQDLIQNVGPEFDGQYSNRADLRQPGTAEVV